MRFPLLVLAALLAAPALAQPDPDPSTAEIAPGVTLTVDWGPVAALEVVRDEDGYPVTVGGCEEWVGEYYPDLRYIDEDGDDGNGQIVLTEATLVIGARRVALDTECVGGYVWSPMSTEADAFEVARPFSDAVELTLSLDWDASGSSTVTWTVGPEGAIRSEAGMDTRPGVALRLLDALDADRALRGQLAQALAASVAADRAAEAARQLVAQREEGVRRAAARTRAALEDTGGRLDAIGIALPSPGASPDDPLRLSDCAVVPDSTARVEPGVGAALTARVESATAAVAWVDFGDGTSDLVVLDGTALRVPHVYAVPGAYRATVTATDPGGSETCAVDVTVGEGEDPLCADVTELNPVFFEFRSTTPRSDGDARIDENADLLRRCPSLCVQIDGFGDGLDDLATTEDRAEVVRQGYVARGLAASRLRTAGRGEGPSCLSIEDPTGPGNGYCRRVDSVPGACAELR